MLGMGHGPCLAFPRNRFPSMLRRPETIYHFKTMVFGNEFLWSKKRPMRTIIRRTIEDAVRTAILGPLPGAFSCVFVGDTRVPAVEHRGDVGITNVRRSLPM
jgi:hypothetical protein